MNSIFAIPKRKMPACLAVFFACSIGAPLFGQFASGSNGSYGPIDLSGGSFRLPMPADGVFHCTTIDIAADAYVQFQRNGLNTPVYLLATGDVNIHGAIDVSAEAGMLQPQLAGQGGPGGFDGGSRGLGPAFPPGPGHGPGAGQAGSGLETAGRGAYANLPEPTLSADGTPYGTQLLMPLIGGSGGGGTPDQPGGGGGGAILIASKSRVNISGSVRADGGYYNGSGGAIRIVAPRVIGTGYLSAYGHSAYYGGSSGRIRVDMADRTGFQLSLGAAPEAITIGSFMVTFPKVIPRLDIIEAAGETIAEDAPEPVNVMLPFGSDPARTVKVQARDFSGVVPIRVVLTPDSGDELVYDAEIIMGPGARGEVDVDVEIPVNTVTRIYAWTR